MSRRKPLPDTISGRAFSRSGARRAGVAGSRLRGKDLRRPWADVYTTRDPETHLERCRAYAVRLKPGQFFTHATAAALLGVPLPSELAQAPALHVGAIRPADAPHAEGVVGHRLSTAPPMSDIGTLPVVAAHEVFCQLGATLAFEDLVIVADHLLNTTELAESAAKTMLLERIAATRRHGSTALLRAVRASRRGSRSPAETRVRVVLDAAGVPPAELNAPITTADGRYLGSPDFVWREQHVVLEYEGAGHREEEQFRYDVLRYEELADAGWRVMRATGDDLTTEGRRRLGRRVLAALA